MAEQNEVKTVLNGLVWVEAPPSPTIPTHQPKRDPNYRPTVARQPAPLPTPQAAAPAQPQPAPVMIDFWPEFFAYPGTQRVSTFDALAVVQASNTLSALLGREVISHRANHPDAFEVIARLGRAVLARYRPIALAEPVLPVLLFDFNECAALGREDLGKILTGMRSAYRYIAQFQQDYLSGMVGGAQRKTAVYHPGVLSQIWNGLESAKYITPAEAGFMRHHTDSAVHQAALYTSPFMYDGA
ncbi:MAG: hypothetical protein WBO55_18480 [Rhizobiaceae bacterium]